MTAYIDCSVFLSLFLPIWVAFKLCVLEALKVLREEGAPSPFHASTVEAAPRSLPCEVHLNKGLHYWKQLKAFSPFSL